MTWEQCGSGEYMSDCKQFHLYPIPEGWAAIDLFDTHLGIHTEDTLEQCYEWCAERKRTGVSHWYEATGNGEGV